MASSLSPIPADDDDVASKIPPLSGGVANRNIVLKLYYLRLLSYILFDEQSFVTFVVTKLWGKKISFRPNSLPSTGQAPAYPPTLSSAPACKTAVHMFLAGIIGVDLAVAPSLLWWPNATSPADDMTLSKHQGRSVV